MEKRSRLPLFGNFKRRASGEKNNKQTEKVLTSRSPHGSPVRGQSGPRGLPPSPGSQRTRHNSGSPSRSKPSREEIAKKSSTLPVAKTEKSVYNSSANGAIASRSWPAFMNSPNMPRHRAPGKPMGLLSPSLTRKSQVSLPRMASGQSLADKDLGDHDYAEIWDDDDEEEEDEEEEDTIEPGQPADSLLAGQSRPSAGEQSSWLQFPAHHRIQPSMPGEATPLDMSQRNKAPGISNTGDALCQSAHVTGVASSSSSSNEGLARQGSPVRQGRVSKNSASVRSSGALSPPPGYNTVVAGDKEPSFGANRPLPPTPVLDDLGESPSQGGTSTRSMGEEATREPSSVSRLCLGRAYSRPTCGVRMRELRAATKRLHCISPPTIEEEPLTDNVNRAGPANRLGQSTRSTTNVSSPRTRSPAVEPHTQRAYSYPEESLEPDLAPHLNNLDKKTQPSTPTSPRRNIYGTQRANRIQQQGPSSESREAAHSKAPASPIPVRSSHGRAFSSSRGPPHVGHAAIRRSKDVHLNNSLDLSDSEVEMSSYGLTDNASRPRYNGSRYSKINNTSSTCAPTSSQQGPTVFAQRYGRPDNSAKEGVHGCAHSGIHPESACNPQVQRQTKHSQNASSSNQLRYFRKTQVDTQPVILDCNVTTDSQIPRHMNNLSKCDASAQTPVDSERYGRRLGRGGMGSRLRLPTTSTRQGAQDTMVNAGPSSGVNQPVGSSEQSKPISTGVVTQTYGKHLGRMGSVDKDARSQQRSDNKGPKCHRQNTSQISVYIKQERDVIRKNLKKTSDATLYSSVIKTKSNVNRNTRSQTEQITSIKDTEKQHRRRCGPGQSNSEKKPSKIIDPAYKKSNSKGHTSDTEEYSGSCESSMEDLTIAGKYKTHVRSKAVNVDDISFSSSLSSSQSSLASTSSGTTSFSISARGQRATKDSHSKRDTNNSKKNVFTLIADGGVKRKNSGAETRISDTGYGESSSYNGTHIPDLYFTSSIEESHVCVNTASTRKIPQEGCQVLEKAVSLARANSAPSKTGIPKSQMPHLARRTNSLGTSKPSGSKTGLPRSSTNVNQKDSSHNSVGDLPGKGKSASESSGQRGQSHHVQVMNSSVHHSTPPSSPRPHRAKATGTTSSSHASVFNTTSASLSKPSRTFARSKVDLSASRSNLVRTVSKSKLISNNKSNPARTAANSKQDYTSSRNSNRANATARANDSQAKTNSIKSRTSETKKAGLNLTGRSLQSNTHKTASSFSSSSSSSSSSSATPSAMCNQKPSSIRKPNTSTLAMHENGGQEQATLEGTNKPYNGSLSQNSNIENICDKEESHQKKKCIQKPPLPPRTSSLRVPSKDNDSSRQEHTSPPPVASKPHLSRFSKIKPPSQLPSVGETKSKMPLPKTAHTTAQNVTSVKTKCEKVEIQPSKPICETIDLTVKSTSQTSLVNDNDVSAQISPLSSSEINHQTCHVSQGSHLPGLNSISSQSRLRKPYNTGRYSNVSAAHKIGAELKKTDTQLWCTKAGPQTSHNNAMVTITNSVSHTVNSLNATSCKTQDITSISNCDTNPSNKSSKSNTPTMEYISNTHFNTEITQNLQRAIDNVKDMANTVDSNDTYSTCYKADNIMVIECKPKEIESASENIFQENKEISLELSDSMKPVLPMAEKNSSDTIFMINEETEGVIEIETIEVRSFIEVYRNGNIISRKISDGNQVSTKGNMKDADDNEGTIDVINMEGKEEDEHDDKLEEVENIVSQTQDNESHNSLENETPKPLDVDISQGLDSESHADSPVCDSGIMSESSEESNHAGYDDCSKFKAKERNSFDSGDTHSLFSGSDEGVAPTSSLSISSTLDENRNLASEGKTESELVEEYISQADFMASDQSESEDNGGQSDATLNGSEDMKYARRKVNSGHIPPPMDICSAATTPEVEHGMILPKEELKHCMSLDETSFTSKTNKSAKQAVNVEFIIKHGTSLDSANKIIESTPQQDDNFNKTESDETIKADGEYKLELLTDMCEEYISVTRIHHDRSYSLNTNNERSKIDSLQQTKQKGERDEPVDAPSLSGMVGHAKITNDEYEGTAISNSSAKGELIQTGNKKEDINFDYSNKCDTNIKHASEIGDLSQAARERKDGGDKISDNERKGQLSRFLSDDMLNNTTDDICDKAGFFLSDPYEDICDERLEALQDRVLDKSYEFVYNSVSPAGKNTSAESSSSPTILSASYGSSNVGSKPNNSSAPLRSASSPNLQNDHRHSYTESDAECLLAGGSPLKRAAATSHLDMVDNEDDILLVDVSSGCRKLISQSAVSENALNTNSLLQQNDRDKNGKESPVDPSKEKEVTEAAAKLREFLENSISENTGTGCNNSPDDKGNKKEEMKSDLSTAKSCEEVVSQNMTKENIEQKKDPLNVSCLKSSQKVDVDETPREQLPKSASQRIIYGSPAESSPKSPSHKGASPSEGSLKCRIPKPRALSSRIPTVGDRNSKEGSDTKQGGSTSVADVIKMFNKAPCTVDVNIAKQRDPLTSPRIDEGYGTLRGSEKVRECLQKTSWD